MRTIKGEAPSVPLGKLVTLYEHLLIFHIIIFRQNVLYFYARRCSSLAKGKAKLRNFFPSAKG